MTRLKQHSFVPFHRSVVLQITNKCPFRCKSCSQKLGGNAQGAMPIGAMEKNIAGYISTPVPRHGRPEVTVLGGAAESHPDYLQIVKLLSDAHPKQLDLYLQYYYARPEFAQLAKIVKKSNTPVNFVFSCDRMHASGWHSMHKWAESALRAFLSNDLNLPAVSGGQPVKFVFSSTKFSPNCERETEAFFNRLRREFGDCFEVKYWQGMRLREIRENSPLPNGRFLNIAPDGKIYLSAKAQARGIPAEKELLVSDWRGIEQGQFSVLHRPLESLMDILQWTWRQGN